MSKTRQTQIMLLLAVYLLAVLGHLCILRPLAFNSVKFGLVKTLATDKLHNKTGRDGIKLKKIAKTVLNRSVLPQKGKVLRQLYVATLLHNVLFRKLHNTQAVSSVASFVNIPVNKLYPLRI